MKWQGAVVLLLLNLSVYALAAFMVYMGISLLGKYQDAAWFLMVVGMLMGMFGTWANSKSDQI